MTEESDTVGKTVCVRESSELVFLVPEPLELSTWEETSSIYRELIPM